MVWTHQAARIAAALYQLVGAVLTDIEKSSNRAVTAHHAEQAVAGYLEAEVIARFGQLRTMSRELPGIGEQGFRLAAKMLRVRVESRIKRAHQLNLFL